MCPCKGDLLERKRRHTLAEWIAAPCCAGCGLREGRYWRQDDCATALPGGTAAHTMSARECYCNRTLTEGKRKQQQWPLAGAESEGRTCSRVSRASNDDRHHCRTDKLDSSVVRRVTVRSLASIARVRSCWEVNVYRSNVARGGRGGGGYRVSCSRTARRSQSAHTAAK